MATRNKTLITRLRLAGLSTALVLAIQTVSVAAVNEPQMDFESCRVDIAQQARAAGMSSRILEEVVPALKPLERVVQLDRKQPEFTETFAEYISRRVTEHRISVGRKVLRDHGALLTQLTKQYGVPGRYLVAFWGLETNFGGYKGKIPLLDALATLACDKRRSAYFNKELFILLGLLDKGVVEKSQLKGSWAGAMGHMQFMPSTLASYGLDADGDRQINVWESIPDALTSAANYLNQIGWQAQTLWGRQVELPGDFPYQDMTFGRAYSLAWFRERNVKRAYGNTLPKVDLEAKLIVPAGHKGPAFLAYPNFEAIMKWNRSQNYALAVGILADELVGIQHDLKLANLDKVKYRPQAMKALQAKLNDSGFDAGKPDGLLGPKTRAAIQAFQLKNGLVADGYPNQEVFKAAGISQNAGSEETVSNKKTSTTGG